MPVRRRTPKRCVSDQDKAMAWGMAFETSRDFFGELIPFGLVTQEAVATAAPAAWKAYGAWYMANRVPANREIPWALETFGGALMARKCS